METIACIVDIDEMIDQIEGADSVIAQSDLENKAYIIYNVVNFQRKCL